jgi:uncharacterized Zn finger protein (UPF0148 family)
MASDMCPGCGSMLLGTPDGKVCLTCATTKSGTEQGEPAWDEFRKQATEPAGASEEIAEQNNQAQLRLDPQPAVAEEADKVPVLRPEQNKLPSRFDYERMLVETPPPVEQAVEESEPAAASSTIGTAELAGPATDQNPDQELAVQLAGLRRLVPSIRKHLLDAYEEMSQVGIIAEQLQIKLEAKSETDLEKQP